MQGVAEGTICIPKNKNHQFEKIMGVGKGLSTKVNANIGSSKDYPEVSQELQKLCVCLKAGADTVMDLSMGGELDAIRREILKSCPIPLGTVPIYQSHSRGGGEAEAQDRRGHGGSHVQGHRAAGPGRG